MYANDNSLKEILIPGTHSETISKSSLDFSTYMYIYNYLDSQVCEQLQDRTLQLTLMTQASFLLPSLVT